MTALNKDALKALFQTGSTITQTSMGSLIDSFIDVVETSAQTIASPLTLSGAVALNGGVSVSAITSGQLMIGNASNTLTRANLIAGTNIVITNGPGTIQIDASPGSATGVLLSTQTASNSPNINFNSSVVTNTYDKYIIEIIDLVPSAGGAAPYLTFSKDNGANILGSGYAYIFTYLTAPSSTAVAGSSSAAQIQMEATGIGSGSGQGFSGTIEIYKPSGTINAKRVKFAFTGKDQSPALEYISGSGDYHADNNAINYFRLAMSTNNIASGTFKLYGV